MREEFIQKNMLRHIYALILFSSSALYLSYTNIMGSSLSYDAFISLIDARGFAVRTGHHCAQPLLNRLGITNTVRASFYLYNTMREAELFIEQLKEITERFG